MMHIRDCSRKNTPVSHASKKSQTRTSQKHEDYERCSPSSDTIAGAGVELSAGPFKEPAEEPDASEGGAPFNSGCASTCSVTGSEEEAAGEAKSCGAPRERERGSLALAFVTPSFAPLGRSGSEDCDRLKESCVAGNEDAVARSGPGSEGISTCLKPEPRGGSGRGGEGGTSASTSIGRGGGGGGDLARCGRWNGLGLRLRETVGLPPPCVPSFSVSGALGVVLWSGTGEDVVDRAGGGGGLDAVGAPAMGGGV